MSPIHEETRVIESLAADLRQHIKIRAAFPHPRPERRFHKHGEYLSCGLTTPDLGKILKAFRSRFLALSLPERLDLAAKLLSEHIGELGHAGIHVVALSVEELSPGHLSHLDQLGNDFRSWSHVDHFCGDVLQPLLWKYREDVLTFLRDWNGSANRWKRRASVVVFTRNVGESGVFTDELLGLCENLVWDEEDIVQKGVGWALKDNMRSAPERIVEYVTELRQRGVPSTITLYAIRDLKGAEREAILAVKSAKHGS